MRLVFDTENTGAQRNKAHPFDDRNKCCLMGFKDIDTNQKYIFKLEYDDDAYGNNLREIQRLLDKATVLIGFNLKYDLHWCSRYLLNIPVACRLFDCQVSWFILTHQKHKYPSLDQVAEYYGCTKKLDVVKLEYWEKGFDTNEVPLDILTEYLEGDLDTTHEVYNAINKDIQGTSFKMNRLISVSNQDLAILQNMEQNGMLYNKEESLKIGDNIESLIQETDEWIKGIAGESRINISSGDHLSVILYGGTISFPSREDYVFTYKDGRTAIKNRPTAIEKTFQGYFKPLDGTDLKKDGYFATNNDVLKNLLERAKGDGKTILELLLYRSKIEKQRSTYYHGFPKRIDHLNWRDNVIHTNLNQCVVVTGRLSSSAPNVQNIEEDVKKMFITRY